MNKKTFLLGMIAVGIVTVAGCESIETETSFPTTALVKEPFICNVFAHEIEPTHRIEGHIQNVAVSEVHSFEGYRTNDAFSNMCIQTALGFCYAANHHLYYSENMTEFTALCGRPDCMHMSYDCDAYIGSHGIVGCFRDKIFYTSNSTTESENEFAVFSMNLDGTDHQEFFDIPFTSNASFHFHFDQGYLYYMVIPSISDGEDQPLTTSLY